MSTSMAGDVFAFPASSGQRRLWLLDQLLPGSPAYVIGWQVRLSGPLDQPALAAALRNLVDRHEALRTTIRSLDGEPVQVVAPTAPVALPLVDLSGEPAERRAALAAAAATAQVRLPFDLSAGPLLRTTLLRLAADEHVLVLVLHHAVVDGRSCAILLEELASCYAAEVNEAPALLPEPALQYPDYAVWQREQVDAGAFAGSAEHWRRALAGAPTLLQLPTDRPRTAIATAHGAEYRVALDERCVAAAAALAAANGGTLFGALLAVFQAVLHRLAGQSDFLVGTPVSGRSRPETDRVVGFLVNTLPLRARVEPATTFADLLGAARDGVAAALSNQDLPFEHIVELLAPERSLGHSPVVQVLFAVESSPPVATAAGLTMAAELIHNGGAKFDVSLTVERRHSGWRMSWVYDTDLFDADTMAGFARMYAAALAAATARPDRRVGELPLGANPTAPGASGASADTTAGRLITEGLRRDPDATAVVGPDATLTYAELDAASNRLAHALRAHGVGPDVPVALCLERGAAMITGVLATWKAGGGYLPLDPQWPVERLASMARDAEVPVVVTDKAAMVATGGEPRGPWQVLDLDDDAVAAQPATPPEQPAGTHPDTLAYLLYTSGSTGTPKGVVVTHRGLVNLLTAMDAMYDLSPTDRLVAVSTPTFDISVVEMIGPLLRGATVIVLPYDEVVDGHALRQRLVADGATVMQSGPALWRMLVAAGGPPPGVRLRITAGEALSRDLADALLADSAVLIDGYGPTETTVYSAAGPVPPGPAPIRLGPPVANTTLHVLDPALQPVPDNVIGELYIGGPGVARGYHGRPGLTAERFLPDPFARPGCRMYATGDLVRRRPGGGLEFLGRADHQMKIRGFRIEPGEIEARLREHELIDDAVVTPWRAGDDDVRLVAYVVADGLRWSELRPWLARRLPEYMLPATCVVLDALPRTTSGKIDRGALPAPVWTAGRTETVLPRTPTERQLAEIWRGVLSLPDPMPLGVHDNFFTLGGHSLTATQLLARIRTALGAELPLATLFAAPTIAELAAVVASGGEGVGPVRAPGMLLDQLDELSDAEVDRLLGTLIEPEPS